MPFQILANNLLDHLHITDLYIDSYNFLWIGTFDNGLFYLHLSDRTSNTLFHFEKEPDNPNSITNNQIIDIYEDLYSNLWISTAGGLNRWSREGREFENFDHIIDPSSVLINGVLGDNLGYIWLNSLKESSFLEPDIFDHKANTTAKITMPIINATKKDGACLICSDPWLFSIKFTFNKK